MATYDSAIVFIETADSVKAKIVCIDLIIDGLLTTALKAVENDDIDEYWIDDGQIKIKTIYRSSTQVMAAIQKYRRLKNEYMNLVNGHIVLLQDKNSNRHRRS